MARHSHVHHALDAAAISLSGACFVHCLILPFAAGALPLLGTFAQAEWVHWVFVAVAAPVAAIALWPAILRRPVPWLIPFGGMIGVALLVCGALDLPNHLWGAGLTVAGGLSLAAAHVMNWNIRRFDRAND